METYKDVLTIDDFSDKAMRFMFLCFCECYSAYGECVESEQLNLCMYNLYTENYKEYKGFKLKDFSGDTLKMINNLGYKNISADNEVYRKVKNLSLIRQLKEYGFPINIITENPDYVKLSPLELLSKFYKKLDEFTDKLAFKNRENLNSSVISAARIFLEQPEYGIQTPFQFINENMHGLCRNNLLMIGGATNSGKSKMLMNLLVYMMCVEKQKVCLISNEMTRDDFMASMICTIVNMHQLRPLHGKTIKIAQNDIMLSNFYDDNGKLIKRLENETIDDYEARLINESETYRDYRDVLIWYEQNFSENMLFVNVADDYSTDRLKKEIDAAKRKGFKVFAYDTLKSYRSSEWGDLVQTATGLSELIKGDEDGICGIATFQLTDDIATCYPEELSTQKIAVAKHIAHVADEMIMFMHIDSNLKNKYEVEGFNGETSKIHNDANIAACKIIKNRHGDGKNELYAIQLNLATNVWMQIGKLKKRR